MIDLSLDTIGGYHSDESLRKWPPGSCWENEGRYLYKTVREMRPAVIVEVGRWEGCSASHLALGCKHNGFGRVYSIDINPSAGAKIPADLLPYVEFINRDVFAIDWQKDFGLPIDLLLEDGHHSPGFTEHVLRHFPARRVIVHDYNHWDTQKTVRPECLNVLGEPDENFFEPPSDCGYAVYRLEERGTP